MPEHNVLHVTTPPIVTHADSTTVYQLAPSLDSILHLTKNVHVFYQVVALGPAKSENYVADGIVAGAVREEAHLILAAQMHPVSHEVSCNLSNTFSHLVCIHPCQSHIASVQRLLLQKWCQPHGRIGTELGLPCAVPGSPRPRNIQNHSLECLKTHKLH